MVAENSITKYHVTAAITDSFRGVSDTQLENWATDPNCIERDTCAEHLAERRGQARARAALNKLQGGEESPFNPRTEVSLEARQIMDRLAGMEASLSGRIDRIVKHLWILFVLLPVIIGVLLAVLGAIK